MGERGVKQKLRELYGIDDIADAGFATGVCNNCFFVVLQLAITVTTFEMQVVPGLGQLAWVMLSGWVRPWEMLAELMPTIGYRSTWSQFCHILGHPFSYVGFGAVAFVLECLPFVNIFF